MLDTAPAALSAPPAGPDITIEQQSATSLRLRVDGSTEPFWLVLGQSHSDGWEATVPGRGSLGAPVVVDGYANGWLVQPNRIGGSLTIELRWTPQQLVWAGLALSGVAIVTCIALIVLSPGRRRAAALPWVEPTWTAPAARSAARGGLRQGWWVPVGAGLAFGLLAGWLPGVAAAGAGVLVLWRPRWRRVLVWVPPAFLLATAVYVVAKLLRYDIPPTIDWPNEFEVTNAWAWAAVGTATTLAVADRWRERRSAPAGMGEPGGDVTSAGGARPSGGGGGGP